MLGFANSTTALPSNVDVIIYNDCPDGFPCDNDTVGDTAYVAHGVAPASGTDDNESFIVDLPSTASLSPGAYWLSVVVQEDFDTYGQWFWFAQTVVNSSEAALKDPANLDIDDNCPDWTLVSDCDFSPSGDPFYNDPFDLSFALYGTPGSDSSPTITSVSPNPVTGSDDPQPFTINGGGFEQGANVTLRDLTNGGVFANRDISSFSPTEIVINPIFTTEAATWSVEVINPGGESSGEYQFEVVAPSGSPANVRLTSVLVKQQDESNFTSYDPSEVVGVLTGAEVQFEGVVTDSSGNPVSNQQVEVYNSLQYAPDAGDDGTRPVTTGSDGTFTYPADGGSISTASEPAGVRPFWFNAGGTDVAVPFALYLDAGEDIYAQVNQMLENEAVASPNIVSMRVDTTASNPFADLFVRGQPYPADEMDLSSPANDDFFRFYAMVYSGPTALPFLINADMSAGWLKRGYDLYRLRAMSVMENLPERFQANMPPANLNLPPAPPGSARRRERWTS